MDLNSVKDFLNFIEDKPFKRIGLTDKEGFSITIEKYDSSPMLSSNAETSITQSIIETKNNAYHIVTSPLVGIVHLNIEVDELDTIKVGKNIKKGQILCSIEAMKLMNDIESDINGVIEQVYINDGDVVEYGTPLFKVKLEK